MQYAKMLLGVSLLVGSLHVQAAIQTGDKDDQMILTPSTAAPMNQADDLTGTKQKQDKYAKVPVAPSPQSKPTGKTQTYEVPIMYYNNGGHFGN